LPADDACFVVFDFNETKSDGRLIKKLVLVKWCVCVVPTHMNVSFRIVLFTKICDARCRCPDTVNFRVKPVIGASYQTLKEKFAGLGKDIQAVDTSDLDYNIIKNLLA
jgi:hypothetical protein